MAGKKMPKSKDVRVFRKGYARTKKINRATGSQQGGIRF